jgi:hypothetical protein
VEDETGEGQGKWRIGELTAGISLSPVGEEAQESIWGNRETGREREKRKWSGEYTGWSA